MKEKDNSGVCGIGECDFFLSNIIIYRYNAFFMRLHGARMGVANCRSLLLGNRLFFLFLFECMIMMGGPSTGSIMSQTGYILHTRRPLAYFIWNLQISSLLVILIEENDKRFAMPLKLYKVTVRSIRHIKTNELVTVLRQLRNNYLFVSNILDCELTR